MDAKHSSEFIAVAQRHLEVDEKKLFLIEIGLPYQENDEVWFCPYRLSGPLTKFSGRCGGVDGVQAMLNVFYVLSAEAEGSLENLERRLTWGGQRDHFGFPNHDADPELKMVRENRSKKSG